MIALGASEVDPTIPAAENRIDQGASHRAADRALCLDRNLAVQDRCHDRGEAVDLPPGLGPDDPMGRGRTAGGLMVQGPEADLEAGPGVDLGAGPGACPEVGRIVPTGHAPMIHGRMDPDHTIRDGRDQGRGLEVAAAEAVAVAAEAGADQAEADQRVHLLPT